MADPDEALIEAIAEAIAGGPAALVDLQLRDPGTASNAYRSARAAFAAMVEHLGLTVQYGTDDAGDDHEWATEQADEGSARRIAADDPGLVVVSRVVSKWVEVDHGSE
ncbi:MAG: hypothetical protein ACXVX9_12215 [Mycobacteriaceae bacterium]